jgi:hypothetical protein
LALFLILIIIYNVFSGNDEQVWNNVTQDIVQQWDSIILNFDGDSTKASIEYAWWDRKEIENNAILYKTEKIIVEDWAVSFLIPEKAEFNLDKLGILLYKEDWDIYLDSSNLWVKAINDISISMKFANVKLKKWTVANLNQNDVESSVYVLDGMAEISNLAWVSTVVWKGQKVWVLVQNASDKDIDLSSQKTDLDDYFKLSDWFIKNNWDYYLQSVSNDEENKEDTSSGSLIKTISSSYNNYISFNNISDEAYISTDKIDITWKVLDENVWKITVNNDKEAEIKEDKNFEIKSIDLENKTNDLVFRIYDNDWELLTKFVFTIYNTSSNKQAESSWAFKVTNYDIDASKFVFTSPSTTWTYSTYDDFVTIRWSVPKWLVWKVEVDLYTLKSFNWITWRYHARVEYNNLKVWTNQYEIKYYDKNGKLIFKNYYTIILKSKELEKKTYSDEVKTN